MNSGTVTKKKKKSFLQNTKDNLDLWMFVLPGMVITFIFSYIPLYGLTIAFQRFSYKQGYLGSPWVGLDNFTRFFNSPYFIPTLTNTFVISIYSLIAGFPFPIILAILLNSFRHKRYGKVIQTITYAPNFISTVVMCGMLVLFLSPSSGFVNTFMRAVGMHSVNFMGQQSLWRHIYVWSGIWQNTGFNSVIYFAALAGVNMELYEAATVDGASKFQKIIYIDIPSVMPTAIILLILSCGSILSVGFEKAYLLQNNLNLNVSEIISTYVYKVGLVQNDLSYSTAIGLFNSAINAVLLILVNSISRRVSEYSLW